MAVDPTGARRGALLRRWDWNFDGKGPADALAVLLMRAGQKWHYQRQTRARSEGRAGQGGGVSDRAFRPARRAARRPAAVASGQGRPADGRRARRAARGGAVGRGQGRPPRGPARRQLHHVHGLARSRARSSRGRSSRSARRRRGPQSRHYADQAAVFATHLVKRVWFDPRRTRAAHRARLSAHDAAVRLRLERGAAGVISGYITTLPGPVMTKLILALAGASLLVIASPSLARRPPSPRRSRISSRRSTFPISNSRCPTACASSSTPTARRRSSRSASGTTSGRSTSRRARPASRICSNI